MTTLNRHLRRMGLMVLLSAVAASAQAMPSYDLTFTTQDQSIWDSGDATILNQGVFLGVAWNDLDTGLDLMAGSERTRVPGTGGTIPNPAYAGWLIAVGAWEACNVIGIGCGSRPSEPSTTIPNPIPAQFIDTRIGVELTGDSTGRAGFELGVSIDSGSVDATVNYDAMLTLPIQSETAGGQLINLNAESTMAGVNSLDTNFSELTAYIDVILEASGEIGATGCLIAGICDSGGTSYAESFRQNVVALDDTGAVTLLGGLIAPSDIGLPPVFDGFPLEIDIAGLATVTLYLPQPDASGVAAPGATSITASGADDLVDIFLDIDNIIATALGVPGFFGQSADIPVLGSIGYDIIDVQFGPTIDLVQNFELVPTLMVDLLFDRPVFIPGLGDVLSYVGAWDSLPDMAFLRGITSVTPTFYLDAMLSNETLLDFDLELIIDVLQVFYDFGLLGSDSFGIGNILNFPIDLFQSPAFYANTFNLEGFNRIAGESFAVAVPEPTTLLLLGIGLLGVGGASRRRLSHNTRTQ